MTSMALDLPGQLEQLKLAFDQSFALPDMPIAAAKVTLIAVRVADRPFAIRNADILAVFKAADLTRVPSSIRSLLGLAQFRDDLLPVHDLGPLLGTEATAGSWMVVERSAEAAFAFSSFEGPIEIDERADPSAPHEAAAPRRGIITSAGEMRPIVDLPSILATIRQQCTRTQGGRGEK